MKGKFKVYSGSWFQGFLILLSGSLILLFCLVFTSLVLWPDTHALIRVLTSEEILFSIQLSLITSLISTIFCAVIALPVAYALSRYHFPTSGFMGMVISLPLSLPPLVAGIALLIFFGPSFFGNILRFIGIDIVYTTTASVIAQFFVMFRI